MAAPLLSFVHPDDAPLTRQEIARLHEPQAPGIVQFENRFRTANGEYCWLAWTVADHGGELCFAAREITRRKLRENALAQATAAAVVVDSALATGRGSTSLLAALSSLPSMV